MSILRVTRYVPLATCAHSASTDDASDLLTYSDQQNHHLWQRCHKAWFRFEEHLRRTGTDVADELASLVANGTYRSSWDLPMVVKERY